MTKIAKNAKNAKQAAQKAKPAVARMAAPTVPAQEIKGEGFVARIVGNLMTITVDLSVEQRKSESGKTMIIAQTDRFQELRAPGEWLSMTVCRKIEAKEDAPAPAPAAAKKAAAKKNGGRR